MNNNYVKRQPIEIVLNSKRGTNIGSLDGFKFFELDKEIVARKDEKILLHLKKAFIPFSFYCISSSQKNIMIDVKETQSDGTNNTYAITIPDGNYAIQGLIDTIKDLMESATTFNYKYTITYNDNTSKVKFLISSGTSVGKTELLFGSGTNKDISLVRVLGFNATDVEFTNSTSVESNNVCDVCDGLDSLHCKSNLTGDNIQSVVGAINGGELLIIPVDLAPNSILYFDEGANPFKHQLAMSSIKRIEIKFTDNNDNTVDFNDIPYTLILIVEFIQDPSSIITFKNRKLQDDNTKDTNMKIIEQNKINLYRAILNKKKKKFDNIDENIGKKE
tara:strand:- start:612 stop:1607 length:996 start_codon:yes stop_codon:yes gene_type:complete